MGRLSSFYIKRDTKFPKVLLEDIEKVLVKHNRYVETYHIDSSIIMVNLRGGFESIVVVVNNDTIPKDKMFSVGCVPLSDGTLYSGFKYTNGDANVLAFIIMLIVKYHLKTNVIIGSEDCEDGFTTDFIKALEYLKANGYVIDARVREGSRSPYIKIKGRSVGNVFDKDNKVFNSMFTFIPAK